MTSASEIVEALGGSWDGTKGMAHCPAHDDQNPSLSVTQDGDGVLVYCFGGCSQRAVTTALEGKGLRLSSGKVQQPMIGQNQASDPQPKDGKKTVATAIWLNKNANFKKRESVDDYIRNRGLSGKLRKNIGQVSAQLIEDLGYRTNAPGMFVPVIASNTLDQLDERPKLIGCQLTLLKQQPNGDIIRDKRRNFGKMGGGVVQFGGKPRDILLVAEGVETALSVYEASGEPTWAALSASNMSAITIPARVGVVIVCADNDEAGRKAGKDLAERVAGQGKIAMLAMPDKDGADWNDALIDLGADACLKAILDAPEVETIESHRLVAMTGGELLEYQFPPRVNLLDPWFPRRGIAMVHARPGVGKTMLAFGIASAVASGGSFLGWAAPSAADVLYLDGELQGEVLKERFELFHNTFGDEVAKRIQFVTPDIQSGDMPDLTQPSGQAQIDELVTEKTALIVVDSLSMFCLSGVENDSESWLPVYKWARRHRKDGKSILFIHHSGKSGKQRGTSRREDAPDVIIRLQRADDYTPENNADFEVVFEKSRHPLGKDAAPFRAEIKRVDSHIEWTVSGDKKTERLEEIAEMLIKGIPRKEIADHFGIGKSWLSQLEQQARANGLINDDAENAA